MNEIVARQDTSRPWLRIPDPLIPSLTSVLSLTDYPELTREDKPMLLNSLRRRPFHRQRNRTVGTLSNTRCKQPRSRRLALEPLEERTLLSATVLKPLGDSRIAIGIDVTPGAEGTFDYPYDMGAFDDFGDRAWFTSHNHETRTNTLWATQGTPSTTVPVWEGALPFGEVGDKTIFKGAGGYHSFNGSDVVSLPYPPKWAPGSLLTLPVYRNGAFFVITLQWNESLISIELWKSNDFVNYEKVKVLAELPPDPYGSPSDAIVDRVGSFEADEEGFLLLHLR